MQSSFQVGVTATDLLPGSIQSSETIAKNIVKGPMRPFATGISEGAFPVEGQEPIDAPSAVDFGTMFKAVESLTQTETVPKVLDEHRSLSGSTPNGVIDPSDQIYETDALFQALEAGEIALDDIAEAGSALHRQISEFLMIRAESVQLSQPPENQNMAHDAQSSDGFGILPAQATAIGATDINGALQQVASIFEEGSSQRDSILDLQPAKAQTQQMIVQTQQSTLIFADQQVSDQNTSKSAFLRSTDASPSVLNWRQTDVSQPGKLQSAPLETASGPLVPAPQISDERLLRQGHAGSIEAQPLEQRSNTTSSIAVSPVSNPTAAPGSQVQVSTFFTTSLTENAAAQPPVPGQSVDGATGLALGSEAGSISPVGDTIPGEFRAQGATNVDMKGAQASATQAQSQQVARQITMAIQNMPGGEIEISLSPAELGRVRISLSSAETGMVVIIQAERPETLDLMRRSAEMLANDFRELGYDGTSFSFEGSGQQGRTFLDGSGDSGDNGDIQAEMNPSDASNQTGGPTRISVDGAVDIRI